jgi:hypothetical protein
MKPTHTLFAVLITLCAITLAGCTNTQTGAKNEWDGLVRQPGTRMDAVFVLPDAAIASYTSVMLDPVEVSFARNWDPNRGQRNPASRLNTNDVAAIQSGLADMLRETLRTQLASGGYTLVDEPGPETLRVTAAIVNLFVTAPDTMTAGRGRTYTANSGQMTLVAELRDSDTGELLARAVDTQRGRTTGAMSFTNNVTNTADARRAMNVWAGALVQGLNEMYGRTN